MPNRRHFLETLSAMPFIGSFLIGLTSAGGAARESGRDYFAELGVRRFINAAGTYTALTASLMPEEVVEAIAYASKHYVGLNELHDRVGERIASLVGCEAAMVTAGAASALTLGTAAILTGKEERKIIQLPDLTGMKSEVIIQKAHRFGYEHAVRNCGIRMVEVETRKQLEEAVNGNTALLLFLNANNNSGQIKDAEFAELGKKHGVPTFNDCAADVPPVENLWKYTKMGFDLVTFSGGKGICGPQSAGLLLGRKDLIEAARLNGPPNSNTVGRGMKVNKEELLGMLVAVEQYLKRDHERDWREWQKRAQLISASARSVPGVQTEVYVPDIANHVPHVRIRWDRNSVRMTAKEVVEALRKGDPSIETREENDALQVGVWMMRRGEEKIVARRIRELLKTSRGSKQPT